MGRYEDGGFFLEFQRNPHSRAAQGPEFGQHTEKILSEIGYSKDNINRLKEDIIR